MARSLKPNIVADCVVCGQHFERYVEPSKIRSGKAKGVYCSRKCKGVALSADKHPMWIGGRITEADGYVMVFTPDHPRANNKGYVFEHRLVMESHLGRHLEAQEVVHHKNGNRSDNHIDNLELFASNAEHKRAEAREPDRCWHGGIRKEATQMEATATLLNEDCIAGMEARLLEGSVDVIVTSIPFEEL